MLKSRIASLALAGILTLGATTSAFAAEPVETVDTTPSSIMAMTEGTRTAPTISFNKESKANDLAEKRMTLEGAKDTMEARLLASGKSEEEIAAMREKMEVKFAEMKGEKGADRGSKLAAAAEKGIIKGSNTAGETI